jgi:hypothetical protein
VSRAMRRFILSTDGQERARVPLVGTVMFVREDVNVFILVDVDAEAEAVTVTVTLGCFVVLQYRRVSSHSHMTTRWR